jgi:hypothetical protein
MNLTVLVRTGCITFDVQADGGLRFAWSYTLEQDEASEQCESNKTGAEPDLSTNDSEDAKAQCPKSDKRIENVTAHLKTSIRRPNGPVTAVVLEGVVANAMDKNIAGLRANGVSGVSLWPTIWWSRARSIAAFRRNWPH